MLYFPESDRKNLNHIKNDVSYWHKPMGAILQVSEKTKKEGVNSITKASNDVNEIYIGSLFLLVLSEAENKTFWITKTKQDPPDFIFMTIKKEGNGTYFSSREVEVTRNVKKIDELEKTILNKDKFYPKDTIILCHVETPGFLDLKKLSDTLKNKIKNVQSVFVIFTGGMLSDDLMDIGKTIDVVQLLPNYIKYSSRIDIIEEVKKWSENDEKLIYTKGNEIFWGLRDGAECYPNIFA